MGRILSAPKAQVLYNYCSDESQPTFRAVLSPRRLCWCLSLGLKERCHMKFVTGSSHLLIIDKHRFRKIIFLRRCRGICDQARGVQYSNPSVKLLLVQGSVRSRCGWSASRCEESFICQTVPVLRLSILLDVYHLTTRRGFYSCQLSLIRVST